MGPTRTYFSLSDIDPEHERQTPKVKENKDRKTVTKGESIDEKEPERLKTQDRECTVTEVSGMRWNQDYAALVFGNPATYKFRLLPLEKNFGYQHLLYLNPARCK